MPYPTAAQRRLKRLYHWQPFHKCRLRATLKNGTIYCSNPNDFNDPWDCKPFFNTELLSDSTEREKHIDWAVRICEAVGKMTKEDIEQMRKKLQDDSALLEQMLREHILEMQQAVADRYRVYCMCPDPTNVLMWAHYANKHQGICLEFNVQNDAICGALEVQYYSEFPMTRQYSDDLAENLLPLLAKSDVWKYEKEYRLITQEADIATPHDTLQSTNGHLKLPDGALRSIIVGCQSRYDAVRKLVYKHKPDIQILRARRVQNRYRLEIGP